MASEQSLGELAARLGAELRGSPEIVVDRVDTLERATVGNSVRLPDLTCQRPALTR